MNHNMLKRKDLFWLALVALMALVPAVSAITANSFLMHVLILILLLRPEGLLGKSEERKV